MTDVAVKPKSTVCTVIVVEPVAEPARTTPFEFTVATDGLDEDHVTAVLPALDGNTVAIKAVVEPVSIDNIVGETDTLDTGIVTVTRHVAIKEPFNVVTLMVAVPTETAVTNPEEFTVAFAELELHAMDLFVAFDGEMVAVNASVLVG